MRGTRALVAFCAAGLLLSQTLPLPPADIERALFESVNRERAALNLRPVRLSVAISDLARRHSEEMARLDRLEHESASGGLLADRLNAAGIPNAGNAENVARSDSFDPAFIHEGLMKSGGHRENILLPDVDELGVGVVRAPGGAYYITQDFVRSVTWLDEGAVRTAVLRILAEARSRQGLAPLLVFDEITRTADDFARLKAEGKPVPAIPRKFGETRVNFYAGADLDKIADVIRGHSVEPFRMAGIGVHIAPTPEYPAGAYQICTFLLVGHPALLWDESQKLRAVLRAVNEVRTKRKMRAFELDPALSQKADGFGESYRETRSGGDDPGVLRIVAGQADKPAGVAVAVIYETANLERLAPPLHAHVTDRDTRKVGISVKPAEAGLAVRFVVVLLFED